jgi:anti-sigma regulatory factor (Ser/Thr protein kinase)
MNKPDIRLRVATNPQILCAVRGAVRGYLSTFDLSGDRIDEIVLAVDEACTNCIRHAYDSQADAVYELTLGTADGWLEVAMRDEGVPACADTVAPREPETPERNLMKPGGLGLQLIREVFDEVRFEPGDEQGNCVTMRLALQGNSGEC